MADALFDSILSTYYVKLSLGKYVRDTPFQPSKWTPQKAFIFPLPSELHDDTSVGYRNDNTKAVGDVLNRNFQGLAAATALGTASIIPGTMAMISKGLGESFNNTFPAEMIGTAIESSMGVSANPNPVIAFEGPELRTFAYSWLLQPRNKKESDKITAAIKYLKSRSLPSNNIKDQVSILDYPYLCQVNFYPWDNGGGNNSWGWTDNSIIRYKKCFISNVNVNYAPSNVPAFYGSTQQPVAIQLTLTFREVEYMLANDWDPSMAGSGTLGTFAEKLGGTISDGFKNASEDIVTGLQQASGWLERMNSTDVTKAEP